MKNKPQHGFAKKPLAVGIAAALSMSLLTSVVNTAQAARFELGDVEISFDSTFSVGSSWRTEDRNWNNNIGKSNNANNNLGYDNSYRPYGAFTPTAPTLNTPVKEDVWAQGTGGYSTNGDNGNLNYNAGESFSKIFKGVHELDIQYQNIGVFVRGMYFYDYAMMDEDRASSNSLTGNVFDPCRDGEAKEQVCQDVRLLDAYVYGDFEIGEMPFSVRLGDQVISWGESTLISHGISEINPVDVARLRAPGAEVKEAFIPFGALWASLGVTDNFNVEMFYQYSWEKTILPPPGSYFSTNDFAGDGGQYNNVQLGFGGNPDMNLDFLMAGLNEIGAGLRDGSISSEEAGQRYAAYAGNLTLRAPGTKAENEPEDGGQYGLRLSWFLPALNDTEISLYHVNYHSRRPIFSGVTADFGKVGKDLGMLATTPTITEDNYSNLETFSRVELDYVEDIKMYAMSFNTTIGTTAFAGEVSYRQDEPLQIDDVELLFAAVPQQVYNSGNPKGAALDGVSQMTRTDGTPYGAGETAKGYILSDTIQAQMTLTHLFGPTLGASQFVGLVEVGGININDMPDESDLRLNGPGTARSGGIAASPGLEQALQGGVETNPFPTEFAWGYRAVVKLDYTNVIAGINIAPRVVFAHDVKGITPDPLFMFIEDRKSMSLGLTFDYQSTWSADLNYNSFFGGVGTTNKMEDHDYVSFSIKYSI